MLDTFGRQIPYDLLWTCKCSVKEKRSNNKDSKNLGLSYRKNELPFTKNGKTGVKQVGKCIGSLVLFVLVLQCLLPSRR